MKARSILICTIAGTGILMVASLCLGRYPIRPAQVATFFVASGNLDLVAATVIGNVRLPRILAAFFVGAALSAAGAAYQAIFRNPMVSPDILGASAGSGFGAALAILCSGSFVAIQLTSVAGGLCAVFTSWLIARSVSRGEAGTLPLVLSGMVISSLFGAAISLTKYLADPDSKLPAITFWLMGGLGSSRTGDLLFALIPMAVGAIPIFALRWSLNVLSFGEDEARTLGVDTKKVRLAIILGSTLLSSAAVSVAGMIGWLGLVIPHICRLLIGPDCRNLLPLSFFAGGAFLVLVDDAARSLFPLEIPLGILTALIGAPFFLALLSRSGKGWT